MTKKSRVYKCSGDNDREYCDTIQGNCAYIYANDADGLRENCVVSFTRDTLYIPVSVSTRTHALVHIIFYFYRDVASI